MKFCSFLMLFFLLLLSSTLPARNIYVNNSNGNDTNDGDSEKTALLTIARAQTLLNAGDTIHLCNTGTVYREVFGFSSFTSITNRGSSIGPIPAAEWL